MSNVANRDLLYKLAVSCQDEVVRDLPGENCGGTSQLTFFIF